MTKAESGADTKPAEDKPKNENPKAEKTKAEKAKPITLAELLEKLPPGSAARVGGVVGRMQQGGGYAFQTMDIRLHCPSPACDGIRTYRPQREGGYSVGDDWSLRFLNYKCRNCEVTERIFALRTRVETVPVCEIHKIGELPAFGPPVPARVITLMGPDQDLFIKGRRAENQGLGVGAFAYYRRAVDRQWKRLLAEIIRVGEVTGAPASMTATLKDAAKETQFSKAVEMIREGIPEILKVKGHNPLTILYSSISDGLHDGTDQHCLELAGSVRVLLTELAERLGQALKDESELNAALTKLLAKRANPKSDDKS